MKKIFLITNQEDVRILPTTDSQDSLKFSIVTHDDITALLIQVVDAVDPHVSGINYYMRKNNVESLLVQGGGFLSFCENVISYTGKSTEFGPARSEIFIDVVSAILPSVNVIGDPASLSFKDKIHTVSLIRYLSSIDRALEHEVIFVEELYAS